MLKQRAREPQQPALTSIEHGCFDTSALQDELARALEEDRKYKLTDSMKKRAIHTAANYDEFKNLVACADLKPISQRELRSFSSGERMTNLSYKPRSRKTYGSKLQFKDEKSDQPPAMAVDFSRQWRRYLKTNGEKYQYLRRTTATRLGELFKTDIDADMLANIVEVLLVARRSEYEAELRMEYAQFARDVLQELTKTSRFSLIIDFLDNNQIEKTRDLFTLLEMDGLSEEVEGLKAMYKA